MKKLLCLILTLLLLTGCAPKEQIVEGDPALSFTDSTGYFVTAPNEPKTVAVLLSSYAEVWTLAGGTVSVTVGETVDRGIVSQGVTLVDGGAGKTIDQELLLAAKPDFVIGSADIPAQVEACKAAREAGISAALFRMDDFQDYLRMLDIFTMITGDDSAYDTHGHQVQQRIEEVKSQTASQTTDPKKILFIRAGSQYASTKAKRAPDNFVCTMLEELGAQNIADAAPILLDGLSLEEIITQDPDHIFLTTMGDEAAAKSYIQDLFAQEGWRDLTAVREGDYTFLSKDLFHYKPNARWAEAYETLASILYPT